MNDSGLLYIAVLEGIVALFALGAWARERRRANDAWSRWGKAMRARQIEGRRALQEQSGRSRVDGAHA